MPLMPNTWKAEAVRSLEFKPSVVYKASSTTGQDYTEKPYFRKAKYQKKLVSLGYLRCHLLTEKIRRAR